MNNIHGTWKLLAVLAALGLGGVGCTDLNTVSRAEIADAGSPDEDASMDDAGQDAGQDGGQDGGFDSDLLCMVPETPVPTLLVSIDAQVCSESTENWPECLADECDATSFERACRQFCQMRCEREDWYCSYACPRDPNQPNYCDSDEALDECADLCGNDPDCLNDACADVQDTGCEDLECPSGSERSECDDLSCDNSCDSAFNGVCEDDSIINAVQSICEEGTDCADCGPRLACFDLGAECILTIQCCGFEEGDAFCVNVGTEEEKLGRCVAVCDGPSDCDEGYDCRELEQGGSQVCVPICSLGIE